MGKLDIIIVDDEADARSLLRSMLRDLKPTVNIVAEASSVQQAIAVIEFHKPQLVLLDVELSDGNGFDVLNTLEKQYFHVIFITGYDHYALKAFRYSAVDYLLKPLHQEQLIQAIEKVRDLRAPEMEKLNHFQSQIANPHMPPKQLVVSHNQGYTFVKLDDILKIEASGSYVYFHLSNGQKMLANYNLGYYEEFLPEEHFFRAHKSYIVNLDHVKHYESGRGGNLVLTDNSKVEVAQRRKPLLLDYLRTYNAG
jgi:two-component system LytT family response regulator